MEWGGTENISAPSNNTPLNSKWSMKFVSEQSQTAFRHSPTPITSKQ